MALKQFTLPPDTRHQGDPNPAADMDNVVDALIAMSVPFNVLSSQWGTVDPSGTTDSTTPINNCLTAALAAGAPVYFPPGTYKVSGSLGIGTGQVITGAGENSTIIQQTSTTADTLLATNQRYITIRDIQLLGPSSGTGRGVAFLFTTTALAGINLMNMIVKGFGGNGVHIETPIVSTLTKIRSEGHGGHGFYVNGGTSVGFKVCYANACTGNGYEIDAVNYSQLDSCAADNCATGYQINGSSAIVLNGCGAEVVTNGYRVLGASANVSMLCCKVLNSAGIGFWIGGSSVFNFLLGVREASPVTGATAGIQVDAGSTATVISPQNTTANNLAAGSTQLFLATNLEIHSSGQAKVRADRGSGAAVGGYILGSGGSDKWGLQLSADATSDLHLINISRSNQEVFGFVDQATAPNGYLINRPAGWGSMVGGMFVGDASTAPSSNPAAGGFLYSDNGVLKWRDKYGGTIAVAPQAPAPAMLYGAVASATGQTGDRNAATGTSGTLVSGTVYAKQIILAANTPLNSLSAWTAAGTVATAASITHGWYAICDTNMVVLAVSADQIAPAAFLSVINTEYNLAMATPVATTYTGRFVACLSVSVSAGNMPQLAVLGSVGTGIGSSAPVIHGTAGTQAAPPAVGATLSAITFANTCAFYGVTK